MFISGIELIRKKKVETTNAYQIRSFIRAVNLVNVRTIKKKQIKLHIDFMYQSNFGIFPRDFICSRKIIK